MARTSWMTLGCVVRLGLVVNPISLVHAPFPSLHICLRDTAERLGGRIVLLSQN